MWHRCGRKEPVAVARGSYQQTRHGGGRVARGMWSAPMRGVQVGGPAEGQRCGVQSASRAAASEKVMDGSRVNVVLARDLEKVVFCSFLQCNNVIFSRDHVLGHHFAKARIFR